MFSQGESIPARRQDLPPAYHREGSVYVTRRRVLMEDGSLYGKKLAGWEVSRDETLNLDSEEDWRRAEQMLWKDPAAK